MQSPSTVKNRQTTPGYLATLYIRHNAAAGQYRELTKSIDQGRKIHAFTNSLANYHVESASKVKTMIDDLPSTPVKPNMDMRKETEGIRPADTDNDVALLKNFQAREEAMLELYTKTLDNDGIPQGSYEQLQAISERAQEVVRKIQRTISSGTIERDMTV